MAFFYSYSVVTAHGNLPQLVRELQEALEQGQHEQMRIPLREVMSGESAPGVFLSMPAVSERLGIYINKVATIFERSMTDARSTVNAVVVAFSARSGELLAMLEGGAVTSLKCAAVSALVTDWCARPEAQVLAIAGTGVQARQQVVGVCSVRPIREVRLWARNALRCTAFASELRASLGEGVRVIPCEFIEDAIRTADVIGTATSAKVPLARFSGLRPDVHINCMGGHAVESREVPVELLRTSTLIVEDVVTAVAEAGAVHAGALSLGQLVERERGPLQACRTIFSSTGHAFLDVITTAHLLRRLQGQGDGQGS